MLGHAGEPVGSVDVRGLDTAIERSELARRGELATIPELTIVAIEGAKSECGRWLAAWPIGGDRRDLVVRDSKQGRWWAIREAWVKSHSMDGRSATVVIEFVEPADGPSL